MLLKHYEDKLEAVTIRALLLEQTSVPPRIMKEINTLIQTCKTEKDLWVMTYFLDEALCLINQVELKLTKEAEQP